MLSGIQDFIAEWLTRPWPGDRVMPAPYTRVSDGVLHLGYGDERSPTIRFDPVPLPSSLMGHS